MNKTVRLRTALIASLSGVMLLTTIVQSVYIYNATASEITDNVKTAAQRGTYLQAQNVNHYLSSMESLAFTIRNSQAIQSNLRLEQDADIFTTIRANDEVTSFLERLSFSYRDVAGIIIFNDSRKAYNYSMPFGFYETARVASPDILAMLSSDSKKGYIATMDNQLLNNISTTDYFIYYEKLYRGSREDGVLCILIDSNVFGDVIADTDGLHRYYISDGSRIVYPYNTDEFPGGLPGSEWDRFVQIGNAEYFHIDAALGNGWSFTEMIPAQSINHSSALISRRIIMGSVISFCVYLVLLQWIIHYFNRSLHQVTRKMTSVGAAEYVKGDHRSLIREIESMSGHMDSLHVRVCNLVLSVKNEQSEKHKAQLDLLHAQINPHFLYNTLDAINWMAIERGADEISEMSANLATLFRYGLNNGEVMTSVANELTHLKTYLTIQAYRYNNRFTFDARVEEALDRCRTPNIVLQPFAENCLIHGLRDEEDTIHIRLRIRRQGDAVQITIQDDGAGCDSDMLNGLLEQSERPGQSYGIRNVHRRIQLYFGAQYGVCYLPVPTGTKVRITIPLME